MFDVRERNAMGTDRRVLLVDCEILLLLGRG